MDPFGSIVTTTKRNMIFYGPTESNKVKGFLTEVSTDLETIYYEFDSIKSNYEVLASGYLVPSGSVNSLYDLKRKVYSLEDKMEQRIYIQSGLAQIIE